MKTLCYIQARSGSKRLPGKNMVDFFGVPMLGRAIQKARNTGIFDKIVVSSNNHDILAYAVSQGVNASNDIHTDLTIDIDIALQVLPKYPGYDIACKLTPCIPLLPEDKIIEAVQKLQNSDNEIITSLMAFTHPPERAIIETADGYQFASPEYASTRTQDIPKKYYNCGAFSVFDIKKVLELKSWEGLKTGAIILEENEHQDIDYKKDLQIAKMKYFLTSWGA